MKIKPLTEDEKNKLRPDWNNTCENCGETPVVPVSGLCGPCNWGEAATLGGDWWNDKKDTLKFG